MYEYFGRISIILIGSLAFIAGSIFAPTILKDAVVGVVHAILWRVSAFRRFLKWCAVVSAQQVVEKWGDEVAGKITRVI